MGDIASFGGWLRRRRKTLDLTQAALAERAGCVPGTIKSIEADARRPSKQLAERLADILELRPDERAAFLKAARAELSPDRLASPTELVTRPVGSTAAPPAAKADQGALPSGTVTFLFTDIEGSTRLWEQHPQAMQEALTRHDTILIAVISAHRGVMVKSTGDGMLAAFVQAPHALAAALAAQRALQSQHWGTLGSLRARMALHSGVAEAREGDYFGLSLNRAARLLAVGHGGQILLSRATVELVADTLPGDVELRDLGEHRLKDLSRPEHIFQLISPDLPADFPPLRTLSQHRTNLPAQPTPLIGREREIADVTALLHRTDVRLVTLTGPGGIGKTRLSLQVAAELIDDFANGVYSVDLAPIRDPALVASTIVETLGLKETGNQSLVQQLRAYLHDKTVLLLLDNFEQVLDAAALVAELLTSAPALKVLVTSRAVLHLRGEKEYAVPPLNLPDLKQLPPLASLSQYAAVELFIQRAQDVKLDFQVTNENAPAVAEICHRLDGLPLAIELAAARIKLFAPETLLKRLEQRLNVLTGGPRDLPARQQTIRATIEWSYQLLDVGEQTLFARLGVFVGGCTIEAVEAVCNADGELPMEVVDGIAALLDKSLLRQEEGIDGEPRFVMLETIREYALERLAASGEVALIRRQHAAYYLALAEHGETKLQGFEQIVWLDRLEAEHDNLRAAIQWAIDSPETDIALRLGAALWRFWWAHGYLTEGRSRLARLLALSDPSASGSPVSAGRAHVLLGAGYMANDQSDYTAARAFAEESQAIWRELGDKRGVALALELLGTIENDQGQYQAARTTLERSLALFQELGEKRGMATSLTELAYALYFYGDQGAARARGEQGLALSREVEDKHLVATSLQNLGWITIAQGEYEQARVFLMQSLALYQELGEKQAISGALMGLGDVTLWQGDYGRASELYRQGLVLRQELGDKRGSAVGFSNCANAALMQGEHAQAAALYREGLVLSRSIGHSRGVLYCIIGYAGVAAMQRQPERAAQLSGAVEVLSQDTGILADLFVHALYDRWVVAARTQLDDAAFETAWAEGRAMTLEQAIAYALEE